MSAPTISAGVTTDEEYTDFYSVNLPSHVLGDLLVVYGGWEGDTALDGQVPTGWSELFASDPGGANYNQHFLLWKLATSTADTLTVYSAGAPGKAGAVAVRINVGTFDPNSPWNTSDASGTGLGADPYSPAVVPTSTADRLYLTGFIHNALDDPATPTEPDDTVLAGVSSQPYLVVALASCAHLSAAATDNGQWSFANGNYWRAFSALVNPVGVDTEGLTSAETYRVVQSRYARGLTSRTSRPPAPV